MKSSSATLYCILHAPIVRLAAFRWPKGFPFYPILCDFKSLVDVSRVPSLPPARPFRVARPRSNRGGPVQRSVARITGQEDPQCNIIKGTCSGGSMNVSIMQL